jgi:alanine-glyoxylate transaminase / serine-glyoxylate transaminase / serine-pyruvate transaminase
VIPDRVLASMHRGAPNIYEGDLVEMTGTVIDDLKRLAGTSGHVAIYIGNGHAVWEASVANILAPGDRALVLASGPFGHGWAHTATRLGVEAEVIDFGFRKAPDPEEVARRLADDHDHEIRAVLTVQTDTGSSARSDIPALRGAIDRVGHPALLAVDSIASLGCEPLEMDAWGVDVLVAACQKGLMTPPGVAFTFHGAKADSQRVRCASPYWDWTPRISPRAYYQLFCGTAPTHHLFGLRTALDMVLHEEGLDNVWERHRIFAEAIWAAVEAWGAAGAMELNIAERAWRSHAVTTVRTRPGDATRLRNWCDAAGLTLGVGLTVPEEDPDSVFRIGHMGHLNPPMILGVLSTIEAGLTALSIPKGDGAIGAAATVIAGA